MIHAIKEFQPNNRDGHISYCRCKAAICVEECIRNIYISSWVWNIGTNTCRNRIYDNIGAVEPIFLGDVNVCSNLDVVGVSSGRIVNDAIHKVAQVNCISQSQWPR
jgi:hypothetical protein